jgi:large subunit ribosomal protein L29
MADKALKAADLRGQTDEQLQATLRDTIKTMFQQRFRAATERSSAPTEIRRSRRNIARIKTIIREREIKAAQK